VCRSPSLRADVDGELRAGRPLRRISKCLGVSLSTLNRHREHAGAAASEKAPTWKPRRAGARSTAQDHEPPAVATAPPPDHGIRGGSLPPDDEAEPDPRKEAAAVLRALRRHLDAAEEANVVPSLANAITSAARLLARLSGQLEITEAQIVRSAPWRKLKGLLDQALAPYPEAARSVVRAIEDFGEAPERARVRHMRGGKTRKVDGKLTPRSRQAIAQAVRRVMQLAEYPAKLIARNPIPESAIPKAKQNVALQYLYPDEDAKALAATHTDVGYRLFVGFLHRMGWRKSEALGLRVERVKGSVFEDDEPEELEDIAPSRGAALTFFAVLS
jgi:hypothetical protein